MPIATLLLSSLMLPLDKPAVGQPAPPITLQSWINVAKNEEPTLESLKGKVIMLEFWGTWCGPCVQAMPHIQELHARYKDRGLKVLAISYEDESVLEPWLAKNSYTMTVGSDPTKKVVAAYGIKSWPSTFLIDQGGKVAFAGTPYDVEPAIEKALGLESNPSTLLTSVMSALESKSKRDLEQALKRLLEKEVADFDLAAWAESFGGAPGASAKPLPPEDVLDQCAKACSSKDAKSKQGALDGLVAAAPKSFDLLSWARKFRDAQFPLTLGEFKSVLDEQSFDAAIDALISRSPGADVIAAATRDKKLKSFCTNKAEEVRSFAKKGVMIDHWLMKNIQPKNNEKFWDELSVSGVQTSSDKKEITGVLVGGKTVTKAGAPSFVRQQFARAFVMEALASGKAPKMDGLNAAVEKERDQLVKSLEAKYGPGGKD